MTTSGSNDDCPSHHHEQRCLTHSSTRLHYLSGKKMGSEEDNLYKELNELEHSVDSDLDPLLANSNCYKCLFKKHQEVFLCKKKNCTKHVHTKKKNSKKDRNRKEEINQSLEFLKKEQNYNFCLSEKFLITERIREYHDHDTCLKILKESADELDKKKPKTAVKLLTGAALTFKMPVMPILIGLKKNEDTTGDTCIIHGPPGIPPVEERCLHGKAAPNSPKKSSLCQISEKFKNSKLQEAAMILKERKHDLSDASEYSGYIFKENLKKEMKNKAFVSNDVISNSLKARRQNPLTPDMEFTQKETRNKLDPRFILSAADTFRAANSLDLDNKSQCCESHSYSDLFEKQGHSHRCGSCTRLDLFGNIRKSQNCEIHGQHNKISLSRDFKDFQNPDTLEMEDQLNKPKERDDSLIFKKGDNFQNMINYLDEYDESDEARKVSYQRKFSKPDFVKSSILQDHFKNMRCFEQEENEFDSHGKDHSDDDSRRDLSPNTPYTNPNVYTPPSSPESVKEKRSIRKHFSTANDDIDKQVIRKRFSETDVKRNIDKNVPFSYHVNNDNILSNSEIKNILATLRSHRRELSIKLKNANHLKSVRNKDENRHSKTTMYEKQEKFCNENLQDEKSTQSSSSAESPAITQSFGMLSNKSSPSLSRRQSSISNTSSYKFDRKQSMRSNNSSPPMSRRSSMVSNKSIPELSQKPIISSTRLNYLPEKPCFKSVKSSPQLRRNVDLPIETQTNTNSTFKFRRALSVFEMHESPGIKFHDKILSRRTSVKLPTRGIYRRGMTDLPLS